MKRIFTYLSFVLIAICTAGSVQAEVFFYQNPAVNTTTYTQNTTYQSQRLLSRGSSGFDVQTIQQKLQSLGYYQNSIDGRFGSGTEAAVRNYQAHNGLSVTGVVDTFTYNHIINNQTGYQVQTPVYTPTYTNQTNTTNTSSLIRQSGESESSYKSRLQVVLNQLIALLNQKLAEQGKSGFSFNDVDIDNDKDDESDDCEIDDVEVTKSEYSIGDDIKVTWDTHDCSSKQEKYEMIAEIIPSGSNPLYRGIILDGGNADVKDEKETWELPDTLEAGFYEIRLYADDDGSIRDTSGDFEVIESDDEVEFDGCEISNIKTNKTSYNEDDVVTVTWDIKGCKDYLSNEITFGFLPHADSRYAGSNIEDLLLQIDLLQDALARLKLSKKFYLQDKRATGVIPGHLNFTRQALQLNVEGMTLKENEKNQSNTFEIKYSANPRVPGVETDKPSQITDSSVILHGNVDINDYSEVEGFFVYGVNDDDLRNIENKYNSFGEIKTTDRFFKIYGNDVTHSSSGDLEKKVSGLNTGWMYYYRACISYEVIPGDGNSEKMICGDIEDFELEDEEGICTISDVSVRPTVTSFYGLNVDWEADDCGYNEEDNLVSAFLTSSRGDRNMLPYAEQLVLQREGAIGDEEGRWALPFGLYGEYSVMLEYENSVGRQTVYSNNFEIIQADDSINIDSSSDDPKSSTLLVDEDDESEFYNVFVFELETEDTDIELEQLTLEVLTSQTYSDMIFDIKIEIDGYEIDDFNVVSENTQSADVVFDINRDVTLDADDDAEVSVWIKFKEQDGNYAPTGERIQVGVRSVSGKGFYGNVLDTSTMNGELHGLSLDINCTIEDIDSSSKKYSRGSEVTISWNSQECRSFQEESLVYMAFRPSKNSVGISFEDVNNQDQFLGDEYGSWIIPTDFPIGFYYINVYVGGYDVNQGWSNYLVEVVN